MPNTAAGAANQFDGIASQWRRHRSDGRRFHFEVIEASGGDNKQFGKTTFSVDLMSYWQVGSKVKHCFVY